MEQNNNTVNPAVQHEDSPSRLPGFDPADNPPWRLGRLLLRCSPLVVMGSTYALSPLTASLLPAIFLPAGYLLYRNNAQPREQRAAPERLLGKFMVSGI